MERCCGFTIETGGIIVATKNALQMLYSIFHLGLLLMTMVQYFSAVRTLVHFLMLIVVIGILCISILSIRGIEARKHRYIIPMMIWLVIAVVISFVVLIVFVVQTPYFLVSVLVVAVGLFCMALDIFGIVVMYALYKKFRVQPTSPPSQHNQLPFQCTDKV